MELKTIYENDTVKVESTGRDYDFIGMISNKTDHSIWIKYNDDAYNKKVDDYLDDLYEQCESQEEFDANVDSITYMPEDGYEIKANDWAGILADDAGRLEMELLEEGEFEALDEKPEDED